MNELEKMHTGEIYDPADGDVVALQTACLERLYEYNATRPSEGARRTALLTEMLEIRAAWRRDSHSRRGERICA